MGVEDQLRAAGRAVSEQVRDLPGLDLRTEPAAHRARRRPSRRRPGAGGWLIPVIAAAAMVAVATALVAVRNPPRAVPKASTAPAASRSGESASTPASTDPEALPGYFVALSGLQIIGPLPSPGTSGIAKDPRPDSVVVGETLTGNRLATIAPPAGSTFAGVTGAADDRTFVLDTVPITAGLLPPTDQRTWYLLRIGQGTATAPKLTRLNLHLPSRADVNGIALSPDGTKLAVLYQVAAGTSGVFPYSGPFTLAIYSVATGAVLRSWTGTDPYHGSYGYGSNGLPDPDTTMTWTADGQRLAFAYRSSNGPSASLYLRELRLSGPGNDLFKDSTVIAEIAVSTTTGKSAIWCDSLGITGDGRTATCGAELPKVPPVGATLDALTRHVKGADCAAPTDTVNPGLAEISLTDDKLTRVLFEEEPACMGGGNASVLWSSPSGDTVLGALAYPGGSPVTEHYAVVLYSHGRATTLTWPGAATTLLANETAF